MNNENTANNRINQLFASKKSGIMSIYFCAGHPTLEGTATTIEKLAAHGVDMVEVGIPFSDPMADGPVIQDAATKALRNGMTLRILFSQLKDIRQRVQIPLVLMGYLNPICQYGYEAFFRQCREIGLDGVIIPDLPFADYLKEIKPIADQYDVSVIMLITPETSEARIRFIDQHTEGFIYMVSSAATTGTQQEFDFKKQAYFIRINNLNLRHPRMIGFGISNPQTYQTAQDNAAGVIIGSKFVALFDECKDAAQAIRQVFEAIGKE